MLIIGIYFLFKCILQGHDGNLSSTSATATANGVVARKIPANAAVVKLDALAANGGAGMGLEGEVPLGAAIPV